MGWNRSSNDSAEKRPLETTGKSLPHSGWLRGAIAAAIVVIGAVATCWLFMLPSKKSSNGKAVEVKKTSEHSRIKEASPAVVPREVKPEKKDYANMSPWDLRHLKDDETNRLNAAQVEYWKMFHPYPPPDEHQIKVTRGRYAIFEERVNNEIASVVALEPGTMIITRREYGPDFVKRFLKSLKTPIVVGKDDSDYDKSVKRAVTAAKIELKAAYDRGEDITKIMDDARDELMRLGRYKEDLRKMAVKEARKLTKPEDVQDIVDAVNGMLHEKGIAPIEANSISRIALEMQSATENGGVE